MQLFLKLFGSFLQFSYHCFDRIVINGYLSLLSRENQVAYFFREVNGVPKLTQEVLRQRTQDYQRWVESYACNHQIPLEWAEAKVRKEDYVRPALEQALRKKQWGVYTILKSMEQGTTFRIVEPKYPTADPNYQIIKKHRSRFTHYYFYLTDEVLGPMVLRVGSFLPFTVTAYLNGHSFIERQLLARGVTFRKQDNAFLSVADPKLLQAAADRLSGKILSQRIDYWSLLLGPKFSQRERQRCGGLHRFYALRQVEYCRNFIFQRNWPIRTIFHRSCELGLYLLTAHRLAYLLGQKLTRRFSGKLQNVLQRMDYGQHVFRSYWKHSFLKQYEKFQTFLRNEVVSNDLKDFRLKKSLNELAAVRLRFQQITDRFASFQAEALNVHGEFDLLGRLAQPVRLGRSRIAGLKLQDLRIQRLLEVLLHDGASLTTWTTPQLLEAVRKTFRLPYGSYRRSQLTYDLRKLRAHGLLERHGRRYAYRLTEKGQKVALLFTLFRKRIYGPVAHSLFRHKPNPQHAPPSKIEQAYYRVDRSIDQLLQLLAA
jgi:hypothetical protein